MKNIYLCLAIVGAIGPFVFFTPFAQTHGIDLPLFVGKLFANNPASGFTIDLLISSTVFWLWMFQHRHNHGKDKTPSPIPFIVLNLTIGLSCALPAWLYANERCKQTHGTTQNETIHPK